MSEPIAPPVVPPAVKRRLRWLALVPCLPGITFLLAGLLTDPSLNSHLPLPSVQAAYERALARTHGLYLAGGVVLLVGLLGVGAVAYKIARPGPSYEEEDRLEREREQKKL